MNLGQAISAVIKNKDDVYESVLNGVTLVLKSDCESFIKISNNLDDSIPRLEGISTLREWIRVQKPVTFMEAVNSGKMIKSEFWVYPSSGKSAIATISHMDNYVEAVNGKWYIEEDGND